MVNSVKRYSVISIMANEVYDKKRTAFATGSMIVVEQAKDDADRVGHDEIKSCVAASQLCHHHFPLRHWLCVEFITGAAYSY
jgi:hypothetical protein